MPINCDLVVRRLTADDAEIAVTLVREFAAKAVTQNTCGVHDEPQTTFFCGLLVAGRPSGFLLAHRLERLKEESYKLFIYEINVAPEHQRKGIGTALIEQAKVTMENESDDLRGSYLRTIATLRPSSFISIPAAWPRTGTI